MKFRTEVALPPRFLELRPTSRVMCSGSCFAEHVGRLMSESMPDGSVCVCPHGVLYNPASVAQELDCLLRSPQGFREDLAFRAADGEWRHWQWASRFAAEDREALTSLLTAREATARATMRDAELWVVTFSTDYAYVLRDSEERVVVANCHKEPARRFEETILGAEQMREQWTDVLSRLFERCPAMRVVFTLSPYRYAKHGFHESALSKARLLLLIDDLCRRFPERAAYFPAFEIVTDELRDYRFYAADMLHPSEQAVEFVWERFRQWAFSPLLEAYRTEREQIRRDRAHRSLHPDSEADRAFRAAAKERERKFREKWGEAER
ncbi:MAG: GSCFA domain-containing protein [Alloprevotella sp.]